MPTSTLDIDVLVRPRLDQAATNRTFGDLAAASQKGSDVVGAKAIAAAYSEAGRNVRGSLADVTKFKDETAAIARSAGASSAQIGGLATNASKLADVNPAGAKALADAYSDAGRNARGSAADVKGFKDETAQIATGARDASGRFQKLGTDARAAAGGGAAFTRAFQFATISQGVNLLSQQVTQLSGVFLSYEQGLAALKAITGVTDEVLADLGTRAKDLAKTFGGDVNSQLAAFQGVLSRFGADIAKSPEALGSMANSINLLAKAGGIDAAQSMDALTNAALQFGVDLSDPITAAAELAKMANVLAASAQVGAAEIPQVGEAIVVAGSAAKSAKISFEETNAAVQVLAAKSGQYGSQAGTSLRNVIGLLQKNSNEAKQLTAKLGIPFEELGKTLTTKGLAAAMAQLGTGINKLGSDAEKNAALMQLFGAENAGAAQSFMSAALDVDGAGKTMFKSFTEGVTGTNSAVEQAAVVMDTMSARLDRLKAAVQSGLIGVFSAVGPAVTGALNAVAQVAPTISSIASIGAIIPEGAVSKFGKSITDEFGRIGRVARGVFTQVGDDGVRTFKSIGDISRIAKEEIGRDLKGAFDSISGSAKSIGTGAKTALDAARSSVLSTFTQIDAAGKVSFVGVGKSISNLTTGIKDVATQLLSRFLPGLIATNAAQAGSAAASAAATTGLASTAVATAAAGTTAVGTGAAFGTMWGIVLGPVTLVVAAVAAVGLALYGAYKYIQPFRDAVDTAWATLKNGWKIVQPVLSDVGGLLLEVGGLVFDWFILPLRLGYESAKAVVNMISNLIGSLQTTGNATKSTGSSLALLRFAVDSVRTSIGNITGTIRGVRAVLGELQNVVIETFKAISKLSLKDVVLAIATGDTSAITKPFEDAAAKVGTAYDKGWNNAKDSTKKGLKAVADEVANSPELKPPPIVVSLKLDKAELADSYNAFTKQLGDNSSQTETALKEIQRIQREIAGKTVIDVEAMLATMGADDKTKELYRAVQVDANRAYKDMLKEAKNFRKERTLLDRDADKLDFQLSTDRRRTVAAIYAEGERIVKQAQDEAKARQITDARERERELLKIVQQGERDRLQAQINSLASSAKPEDIANRAKAQAELTAATIKQQQALNDLEAKFRKEDFDALVKTEQQKTDAQLQAVQFRSDAMAKILEKEPITTERLEASLDARLTLIKSQGEKEAKAFIEGTQEFQQQSAGIKLRMEAGDIDAATAVKQLEELRQKIADSFNAVGPGLDPLADIYRSFFTKIGVQETEERQKTQDKITEITLNAIENRTEREYKLASLKADQAYRERLRIAAGNNRLELDAFIQLQADKQKAEEKYLADSSQVGNLYVNLQKSIAAAAVAGFSSTTNKERQNELREQLKSIREQQKAAFDELSKGTIGYEEHTKKLNDLARQRRDVEIQLEREKYSIFNQLQTSARGIADAVNTAVQARQKTQLDEVNTLYATASQLRIDIANKEREQLQAVEEGRVEDARKAEKELEDLRAKSTTAEKARTDTVKTLYDEIGIAAAISFGNLVVQGENAGRALLKTALDTLDALTPVIVAQITGVSLAKPSLIPFGQLAEAAILTAMFKGLVALARGAAGFEKGGRIRGGEQLIRVNEGDKEEFVVPAAPTAKYEPLLKHITAGGTVERYVVDHYGNVVKGMVRQEIVQNSRASEITRQREISKHFREVMRERISNIQQITTEHRQAQRDTLIVDHNAERTNEILSDSRIVAELVQSNKTLKEVKTELMRMRQEIRDRLDAVKDETAGVREETAGVRTGQDKVAKRFMSHSKSSITVEFDEKGYLRKKKRDAETENTR